MKKICVMLVMTLINVLITAQEDYVGSTILRNNTYSLQLYKSLCETDNNIVISPFGISNCMAMAYIGSEGKTQQNIANALNFITPFGVLVGYKQLNKRYQVFKNNEINLSIGNALWIGGKKDIQKKYKNLLKVNFGAHVENIIIKEDDDSGIKEVNRWLKKSSNFNLLSILKQEDVDLNDELIFLNYVYFDGAWENPFNEELTSKEDFVLADSVVKKVDFMNQTSYLKYNENDIFQIIELPYAGKNISMIVLLPKKEAYLDSLERSLNPINFDFWTGELYTKLVSLSMPKFRIEESYVMAQFLNDTGIELAFTDKADYSRISKDPIRLSRIVQKSTIQAVENKNEGFTEFIGTSDLISRNKDNSVIRFRANHPFIFVIKDNLNNCILLIGKLNNPNFNDLSADFHN